MATCEICDKVFAKPYLVKRHKRLVHKLECESNPRGRPRGEKFVCETCGWKTCNEDLYNRHLRKFHNTELQKKYLDCPVDSCLHSSTTFKNLSTHVLHDHSDQVLEGSFIKEISFSTMTEFMNWKLKEERETNTKYVLRASARYNKTISSTTSAYHCHRSGAVRRRGNGIRHMKIQGSCKINKICPALMTVASGKTGVHVLFSNVHIGHQKEVGHISLSNAEREQVATQLAQNVPFDTILKNIRDQLDNSKISRMHLLQRHDLSNILRDFRLDTEKFCQNDAESVAQWIDTLNEQADETVRFYKFQGVSDTVYGLSERDFILVLMTDVQKEMLIEFGKNSIICIDSTHGTNAYDFSLTTILVLDEHNEGFPVAFFYSNRTDCEVMKCFFNVIKLSMMINDFPVQVLMTDDSEAFYNAWKEVMGVPKNKLLCTWHIDRAWRKNIATKVHGGHDLKVTVYKNLRVLLQCDNKVKFHNDLINFLDACEQDVLCKDFGKYFENEYSNRYTQWAYCYRLGMHINTNMHLEAFHRVLKQVAMKGLKGRRMDKSISAVMSVVKSKIFDRLLKLNKGKLSRAVQCIRHRHKASLDLSANDVKVDGLDCWTVKSSTTGDFYTVRKEAVLSNHSNCPLICNLCSVCIHDYSCTCCDYSLHTTMCKHIHLVVRNVQSSLSHRNQTKEKTDTLEFVQQEDNQASNDNERANNDFLLPRLNNTRKTTGYMWQDTKNKLDALTAKMLDLKNSSDSSSIKYINHNITTMLGFLNNRNKAKKTCFPTGKNAQPPNKKSEKQARFYSTKKKRKSLDSSYATPTTEEVKNLQNGLQGTDLFISKSKANDHTY